MKNQLKNPPMIVALVALSVALSGTSYAAITLPKNSVTSTQIKKNAVTSAKVRDGSLQAVDFKAGQLPQGTSGAIGPAGPAGAVGPKGDKGEPGAKGDAGAPGATGAFSTIVVRRKDYVLADGVNSDTLADEAQDVECAAGEILIAGGGNFSPVTHGDARFTGSGPRGGTAAAPSVLPDGGTPTNYRVTAVNPAGGDATSVTVRVFATCAK